MDETPSQHDAVEAVDAALAALRGSSISELEVEWPEGRLRIRRHSSGGDRVDAASEHPSRADELVVVTSQHVGIFHGGAGGPFPKAGAWIGAGTAIGEIETLGIRSVVAAPADGRIADVLVEDGAPVEYGQPLVALRPGALPTEPASDDATVAL